MAACIIRGRQEWPRGNSFLEDYTPRLFLSWNPRCNYSFRRSFPFLQQFLPAEVKPKRELERVPCAGGDTRLAQAALGGKHALAALDVLVDANVHRAHPHTRPALVALLRIAANLEQREARGHLERHADWAEVLAEGAVVFQRVVYLFPFFFLLYRRQPQFPRTDLSQPGLT
jgi:hypothetical protein